MTMIAARLPSVLTQLDPTVVHAGKATLVTANGVVLVSKRIGNQGTN